MVPKDKEKRLSRVLTRVKTVFKKSDGKRPTKAEPSTAAAGTAAATTSAPVEAEASSTRYYDIFPQAASSGYGRHRLVLP